MILRFLRVLVFKLIKNIYTAHLQCRTRNCCVLKIEYLHQGCTLTFSAHSTSATEADSFLAQDQGVAQSKNACHLYSFVASNFSQARAGVELIFSPGVSCLRLAHFRTLNYYKNHVIITLHLIWKTHYDLTN